MRVRGEGEGTGGGRGVYPYAYLCACVCAYAPEKRRSTPRMAEGKWSSSESTAPPSTHAMTTLVIPRKTIELPERHMHAHVDVHSHAHACLHAEKPSSMPTGACMHM